MRPPWLWVVGVIGVVACDRSAPERLRPQGVVALDDGSAVVYGRSDRQGGTRLVRVLADGRRAWRIHAEGLTPFRDALVVRGGGLTLREVIGVGDDRGASLVELGIEIPSGQTRWRRVLSNLGRTSSPFVHTPPAVFVTADAPGASSWEAVDRMVGGRRRVRELVSRDVRTGKIVRKVPLDDGHPQRVLVIGESILVHDGVSGALTHAFGPGGELTLPERSMEGVGCIVGGDYVLPMLGLRFLVSPRGAFERARYVPLQLAATAKHPHLPAGCAEYRGKILIEFFGSDATADHRIRLVLSDRAGRILSDVTLTGTRATGVLNAQDLRVWGSVTRFIPLVLSRHDESGRNEHPDELALVDIERGRVVWRRLLRDREPGTEFTTFLIDRRWYVALLAGRTIQLMGVDGDRGAITGLQRVVCDGCAFDRALGERSVAGGGLWMVGTSVWASDAELPIARLDARTLTPTYLSGPVHVDPSPSSWEEVPIP